MPVVEYRPKSRTTLFIAPSVIKPVQTQNVGFAPILRYHFEKYAIAEIIARNGPLDPQKNVKPPPRMYCDDYRHFALDASALQIG